MKYFDRFDICEAWYVAAHDWGQYGVISRLDDMQFRAPSISTRDDLSDNGRAIYDAINARITAKLDAAVERHDPYARTF